MRRSCLFFFGVFQASDGPHHFHDSVTSSPVFGLSFLNSARDSEERMGGAGGYPCVLAALEWRCKVGGLGQGA